MRRHPSLTFNSLIVQLLLSISLLSSVAAQYNNYQPDYDDVVQQVLQEEREHYGDGYYYDEDPEDDEDEDLRRQQQEELLRQQQQAADEEEDRRKLEQEEMLRQRKEQEAQRIAQEREAAFERDLQRMNEQQQKAAQKQKKQDAKRVRHILQASAQGNHYKVLGLRNFEMRIPGMALKIWKDYKLKIPDISLFRISSKAIRKAYRKLSLSIHPDRNRDGRANEAFVALEHSASVLTDEAQRERFDAERRLVLQQRRQQVQSAVGGATSRSLKMTGRAVSTVRRVLGPFAFPVCFLGALIV